MSVSTKTNFKLGSFVCKECKNTEWDILFLKKNHRLYCCNCGKDGGLLVSKADALKYNKNLYKKTKQFIKKTEGVLYKKDGSYIKKENSFEHRNIYYSQYPETNKKWHIHHIDGNKSNNDIKNLIALPSALHVAVHDLIFKNKTSFTKRELEKLLISYCSFIDIFKDTAISKTLDNLTFSYS